MNFFVRHEFTVHTHDMSLRFNAYMCSCMCWNLEYHSCLRFRDGKEKNLSDRKFCLSYLQECYSKIIFLMHNFSTVSTKEVYM